MVFYILAIIISAIILASSYCINAFINRRHEMKLRRIEFRLDTLNSFLPVYLSIKQHSDPFSQDNALLPNLQSSRLKFQLYGRKDEDQIFDSMIQALESRDVAVFVNKSQELIDLIRIRIKEELELEL
ncbi:hypothetical protein [Endozoicomonas sp. ONNA2]|uniref:hypothetical protein n=1 Tax=Endozoicomonas sp. ONNA2 TaxID=2828741 RepID=UPI002147A90D|nr:hypothetical protein [Endozoicomonas sp. ONNA2]